MPNNARQRSNLKVKGACWNLAKYAICRPASDTASLLDQNMCNYGLKDILQ